MVMMVIQRGISCSSPIWSAMAMDAERLRALIPSIRVSISTRMPRSRGTLRMGPEKTWDRGSALDWMRPLCRRTERLKWRRPRIITPSMTAWPP